MSAAGGGADRHVERHRHALGQGDAAGGLERAVVAHPAQVVGLRAAGAHVAKERVGARVGVAGAHALAIVDPHAESRRGEEIAQQRIHLDGRQDLVRLDVRLQEIPSRADLHQAVALLVRLVATRQEPAGGVDGLAQLRRLPLRTVLLRGTDEERRRTGRLRRGHRRAVEQRIAHGADLGEAPLRLPHGDRGDGGTGRHDVRLEAAVLARAARREVVQVVVLVELCAVGGEVGVVGDVGTDAHDLARHGRVADGVHAGAAVAGGDEHLDVVALDQAIVEHGARVVAVVQGRQAADRHVDHVDVRLLGRVDHAFDESVGRAPRDEQAGAHGDDLRAGGGAAHRAAEQCVARRDARDVRAVRTRHDADVDDLVPAVRLDDERHPLGNRRGRVVRAEIVDVVADLVVGHRHFVGEAVVLVDVDPDVVRVRVPQHGERVGGVAVPVQVAAHLAAEARVALEDRTDPILAGGGRRIGDPPPRERRPRHLVPHVDPRGIVFGERVGVGHPVDDLAFAGAGREQARMVERDAGIDDADGDAAAVPRGIRREELRGTDVADRHVGVVVRRGRAGRGLRDHPHRALRPGIGQRHGLAHLHGVHVGQRSHRLRPFRGDDHSQVIDVVFAVAHDAAQRTDGTCDRRVPAGLRRHQQRDGGRAFRDRLLDCRTGARAQTARLRRRHSERRHERDGQRQLSESSAGPAANHSVTSRHGFPRSHLCVSALAERKSGYAIRNTPGRQAPPIDAAGKHLLERGTCPLRK